MLLVTGNRERFLCYFALFSILFLIYSVRQIKFGSVLNDRWNDCNCSGENLCYPGLDILGQRSFGKAFDCSLLSYVKKYRLTDDEASVTSNDYENLNDDWIPIFVTAVSSNHFGELRKMAKNIMKVFGNYTLIVYDIGLADEFILEMKSWCNLEYRPFNFSLYPFHVRNLSNYAFKMAIVETIQEVKSFFFIDTSGRFIKPMQAKVLDHVKRKTIPPLSIFTRTWHSIYASTNPGMFKYLPLPPLLSQLHEYQAVLFVSDSPYTRKALKWFTLCALTPGCIQPSGSQRHCSRPDKRTRVLNRYMGCHRYDQSFWNTFSVTQLFDPVDPWAKTIFRLKEWPVNLNGEFVRQIENRRLWHWKMFEDDFHICPNSTINCHGGAGYGQLDILVNNAGVSHQTGADPDSAENMDFVYSVNLRSPGGIQTEFLTRHGMSEGTGKGLEEMFARKVIALKRFGTLRELANMVLFVASDEATYITGANMIVDGGVLAGTPTDNYLE
ncbi:unnamed protein product [Bursaphelenchus xylophilus]|uniref:(pine wood nematode) hypothetical protein n=1 Tax=Bursaphelenchus xylophilus TaxID=6326 RepID=A0A1I7RXE6_BURXY|nr:unnamed protein product [Bursaphelenchus xylophilus]CAG9126332.1 unnamed protein product [Bursaphelenchus xylophilus]